MSKPYRPYKFFSDSLKRQICEEVVRGEKTKEEIRLEYGIQGYGNIYFWLRKFGYQTPTGKLIMPSDEEQETPEALKARILALEQQLAQAKLRAKGLDTMIDVAEEELNISIRKKSSTKRSSDSDKQNNK